MIKERIVVIYAETWDELCVKMLPWQHDHCWHYYSGLTADIPEHLEEFISDELEEYVFICEEDEPYKPN